MNDSDQQPKPKFDLSDLSDDKLSLLVNRKSERLAEIARELWEASCEQMVREVKKAWPTARYIQFGIDGNSDGEFWSLEAVLDESGGVLTDYEIDNDGFMVFEESFVNEYRYTYTQQFGIDNYPYFDLGTRSQLTVEEYNKSVAEPAV